MLTAAVVSYDAASRAALAKCLQDTEIVRQVVECADTPDIYPVLMRALPEVVLLDLSTEDPARQFEVAGFLQGLSPAIRIVACSAVAQPDPALLMRAMRYGVREFLCKPVDVAQLREVLVRFEHERGTPTVAGPKKLIAVMGAKGGVGTTTIAVNLSVQLAQLSRKRVALLDLARPMGYVGLMLDLQPKFSIRDAVQNSDRMDAHLLDGLMTPHKTGLSVLAGVSDPKEWTKASLGAVPRIVEVAESHNDYVVADLGVHCPQDWLGTVRGALSILLVTEAHVTSLWAVERQVAALQAENIDPNLVRLVINRWHRRDDSVLKTVEQRTKRSIHLRLPNNFAKVNDAVNSGTPIADNHDNAIVSRLRQFATELAGAPAPPRRVGLGSFFSSNSSR